MGKRERGRPLAPPPDKSHIGAMQGLSISIEQQISALDAAEWDALTRDPFTSHAFLLALEQSGSVGQGTGWHPSHVVARLGGRIVGAAPAYLKTHSQGEYIFDHNWADAYTRAGGDYYPKLQCAVPFSPVPGPRLLARDGGVRAALLAAMAQVVGQNGLSSAHMTFCMPDEADEARAQGWLTRTTMQYHWFNRGYADFDEFLAALSSRKRKAIRKERARAAEFGGSIRALSGDEILPAHWDAVWAFYQDTGARKWGRPYLTRAFFDHLHQMRDKVLLVLAERDGVAVAGALNLIGADALFGRYWGALEDHAFLHFELCYHQAIDWAIARGLSRVEAGAQGDHKLARGYEPVPTHSAHWIADPGFRRVLADYLHREGAAMGEEIAALAEWTPFRKDNG